MKQQAGLWLALLALLAPVLAGHPEPQSEQAGRRRSSQPVAGQHRRTQPPPAPPSAAASHEVLDSTGDPPDVPSAPEPGPGSESAPNGAEPAQTLYQQPSDVDFVRLNDTSLVIKWYISDTAHEHLQFFKIQYKPTKKDADWKTDNREIPPTTRAYQINSLRPGNYFFIVSAVYDNDDNVASDQVKYKLRAKSKISNDDLPEQQAPKIFWHESSWDYIRFKWTYQTKDKDMPYYGYLVYYRSAHVVTDFNIYNTMDENCEIAEIEPETPYEAKVVAYNQYGVSDFSDTIRIKTSAKLNSTTSSSSPTNSHSQPVGQASNLPTRAPSASSTAAGSATTESPLSVATPLLTVPTNSTTQTTQRPLTHASIFAQTNNRLNTSDIISSIGNLNHQPPTRHNNNAQPEWLQPLYNLFADNQVDSAQLARYLLFILLPVLLITIFVICLIVGCKSRRRKNPPDSSTNEAIQYDIEINGYFKNSFPGVEKNDYLPMTRGHGFVNNHPHVNDFS